MRKGELTVVLALLALLIIAASGCGGGDAASTVSGSPSAAAASPDGTGVDDADALTYALDNFTFMTSTYEPQGDVVA